MALGNTSNVLVGAPSVSGGFWVANKLTQAEIDALTGTTDLTAEAKFHPVGFVSEDGITEAQERDTEKVKAWGGDTIRVLQNEFTKTYSLTFMELKNIEVLKLIYGDGNVTEAPDGSVAIRHNKDTLDHKTFVIDVLDRNERVRKVIPNGQITETGELNLTHSAVMSLEITIEAFIDEKGNNAYEFRVNTDEVDPENP